MSQPIVGQRVPEFLFPALLAIPLALVVALIKPALSLPLILGTLVLVVAFLSPLTGLYTLVFSMLLGPEVIVGALGAGTTLGRGVTLRFDDLLLGLVGLGWLGHMAISDGAGRFLRTSLNRPIVYYTAACVFTTLVGILLGRVSPAGGFFYLLKYYEYFFLYFMAVNIVSNKKHIRHLLIASLVTCALVSLYALWQIPAGGRVSAPFEGAHGEPNTLGGYLVFMVGIVAGLLLTPGAVSLKLPLFGLLAFEAVALQATLSRVSFLSVGVVMLAVLEVARRRSITLLTILFLSIMISLFLMPDSVVDRMMYTFNQPEEAGQLQLGGLRIDTSASERILSWQASLEHFWRSPLWGTGVTGGPFMDAMYPRVLTETGLLGMTAFLYLLWSLYRMGSAAHQFAEDALVRGLALGFLLGFLGLTVHAVGANSFIIVRIMEPFWLFAALVVRGHMLASDEPPPDSLPDNPTVVEPNTAQTVPLPG